MFTHEVFEMFGAHYTFCRVFFLYGFTDGDNDTMFWIDLAQMSWFHECSILLAH